MDERNPNRESTSLSNEGCNRRLNSVITDEGSASKELANLRDSWPLTRTAVTILLSPPPPDNERTIRARIADDANHEGAARARGKWGRFGCPFGFLFPLVHLEKYNEWKSEDLR